MSLVLCVLLLPHLVNQKSASHSYSTFDGTTLRIFVGWGQGGGNEDGGGMGENTAL